MRLNPVTIVAMTTTKTSAPPVACTKNTNISDLVAHLPYIKKKGKLFKMDHNEDFSTSGDIHEKENYNFSRCHLTNYSIHHFCLSIQFVSICNDKAIKAF